MTEALVAAGDDLHGIRRPRRHRRRDRLVPGRAGRASEQLVLLHPRLRDLGGVVDEQTPARDRAVQRPGGAARPARPDRGQAGHDALPPLRPQAVRGHHRPGRAVPGLEGRPASRVESDRDRWLRRPLARSVSASKFGG